ncbi:DUF6588 family protein [Echinicola pacifica]|nr:DUF6588 family protein [Echinicola pacifica]
MKKLLYFCLGGLMLGAFPSYSQTDIDIEHILRAGVKDLNTYMGYYVEPAAKGFIYSSSAGWAQTAKPHEAWGFDLKFSVSGATVPSRYETFDFDPNEFEKLRIKGATGTTAVPTMFGNSDHGGTFQIVEQDIVIAEADIPPGLDIPVRYIPTPAIQGALGLPGGTEIIGRFIPEVQFDDAKMSQWGLGFKHDIMQYFNTFSMIPVDFSVLVAYNKLEASYYLNDNETQLASMDVSTWTFQGLLSKKISILTVYGTLGYNSGSSNYNLLGTYEIDGTSEKFVDPVNLSYDAAGLLASLGARLKFGPMFLNADYTFQEFNTVNVGLGVSIR